ncbi:MAG: alpha/beta hydrolase [Methylococcaceae bacterium]
MLAISLRKKHRLVLVLLLANILSCTPMIHPSGPTISSGQIKTNLFITADGTPLPLKTWQPSTKDIKSIIIALHSFNDYSNFFQQPGNYLTQFNTVSYAYDQRGFGKSPNRGLWAGVDTYIADLKCFIYLVKNKHPNTPLYVLGESMGGAIVITTMTKSHQLPVDGLILAAPAVWARQTMPWYQNLLLWTLSHTTPWLTLTGEGLGIKPSDNIEMLRALGRDPLVIKETRVESIYGLVNLMDQALSSADSLSTNTLLLYGEKDEIIPKEPTYQFLHHLTDSGKSNLNIAFYSNGYHMLLRDLQASVIWNDISAWINSLTTPLPSGADKRALTILNR